MNPDPLYVNWKKAYEKVLETLAHKQVILLFSGGKDSSMGLDLLLRASQEYSFSFTPHAGAFPAHRYHYFEIERLNSYWKERGAEIVWHKVAESDEVLEGVQHPCKECQRLRREKFSTFLQKEVKDWSKLVLVACYSLNDLVSYAIEYILGGFAKESCENEQRAFRAMETAQRFYPILRMQEGYTVFRPLVYFDESTVKKHLLERSIPHLSTPCKYSDFRPKRILQQYYEKMGLQFDYGNLFEFMKIVPGFPLEHSYETMDRDAYINKFF